MDSSNSDERSRILFEYESERERRGIAWGECFCGCSNRTPVSDRDRLTRNAIKGHPLRYIQSHNSRRHGIPYVEEDRGYETPCYIWQGGKNRDGYGHMRARGRYKAAGKQIMMAHRYYYEVEYGPIPDGHEIHHLCHESSCQRASHMTIVQSGLHGKLRRKTALAAGWSREHVECKDCGTTERQHYGRGLCRRCYKKDRRKRGLTV